MINGVRQFKLINAYGNEYDMTRPERLFHDPDGLGWGTEADIRRMGMTYFRENEREVHQSPSGEMVFRTYAEYRNFLSFCQVGGLVFRYKPRETWYFVKCLIQIDKSEIKVDTLHLVCPVTFILTSYWYERITAETGTPEPTTGSKTYAYTYAYTYSAGVSNLFSFDLDLPSYFKITIFGECNNPTWRLIQNGEITKTGRMNNVNVTSQQKFVINTNPKEMEIRIYTNRDVRVRSVYGSSDFSTQRIFELPKGQSQLQITTADDTPPKVMIEVMRHV